MLIHSYLTNGDILVDFAVLFLQSLKKWNRDRYSVLFEGRDLSKKQIKKIKSIYEKIEIINKEIDYEYIEKSLGVSVERIKKMKRDCEIKSVNVGISGSVPWKQFISVEDRYRKTIKSGLEYCQNNNIKHMMHFDIDTCFYSSLLPIEEIVRKHDVTLQFRWRPERRLDKTKIAGGFLGFKCNENSYKFIDKWIEIIDMKSLKNKPKGYGQLSLFRTYQSMEENVDIGIVPYDWSATRKTIKRWMEEKRQVIILNASKGNKRTNIEEFRRLVGIKK